MSVRTAPPTPRLRTTRALSLGVLVGCGVLVGLPAHAQTPLPAEANVDQQSPLPPLDPHRAALLEKFRIDTDRAIFGRKDAHGNTVGRIVDFAPVTPDESLAWTEVVQHAGQFAAADLEQHAARDLTRDDLTTPPRMSMYRLTLIRFDGKLLKVRRLPATSSLQFHGIDEVYEALFLPLDEAPTGVVSVVFTELPDALAAVRRKPAAEWHAVDSWATAAGFFFKVRQETGEAAVPLLVGKSVTLRSAEPLPPGDNPAAIDKGLRVYRHIKNDAPVAAGDNWEEAAAWNRVLLHARRFSPEDLERYAAETKFATLFHDGHRELPGGRSDFQGQRDYLLDLVKFEGRLVMLSKLKPSDKLLAAGVETAYSAWIVPANEPRGNPISVVFTDPPPEGIEPGDRLNHWVSFAGYSFKLRQYQSREHDPDDPKKLVTKRAPLLLGRAVIARPDPDAAVPVTWSGFANTALAALVGIVGVAFGVGWWFRHGDRRARQELDAHRGRNPFGE